MSQRIIPFKSVALAPVASPTAGARQASQFAGILDQSRTLICESLDRAVACMLDKAKPAIMALIDDTRDLTERRLYEETREVVVSQRKTLEKQFQAVYLSEFRRRTDRARKIGQTLVQSTEEPSQLELIGEDDFDETLRFNSMAAKLRAYCDEELVALDQRVGVLLGDASLQPNDNPFSPQVICDAYKQACRQASTNARARRVLLKLFDDHVLDDVRSMYKAVNGLLIQNAILPKIRYGVARTSERGGAAAAAANAPGMDGNALTAAAAFGGPAQSEAPAQGGGQDLFSVLQGLVASSVAAMGRPGMVGSPGMAGSAGAGGAQMPLSAQGFNIPSALSGFLMQQGTPGVPVVGGAPGGAPALQGPALLGSLTQIQRGDFSAVTGGNFAVVAGGDGDLAGGAPAINILRELKVSSVGAGMGAMDHMTLDIVAMLFDQIFDDPKVPNGVKGLIGRMQIPMLKVAIADKSFFSAKTHPARQLLDALGEIASCLPADFAPGHALFLRLEEILEELVTGYHDDLEIFTTVRGRLEALLEEEDRRMEQEGNAAAQRVEEMEKLAVAKRMAEDEVRARVEGRDLPQPVVDFFAKQWLKLLLLVHVKEGPESAVWKRAIDAMDRLVWSIEPRHTHEERRQVVAVIPGLVKQIAIGLKGAGIGGEERSKFFSELMKLHRLAIAAPGELKMEGAPDEAEGAAGGPADAGSVDAGDHLDLDFSQPVTVRNPFGDGEVNVSSLDLDFSALETASAPARSVTIDVNPVASLVVGMWVEFREDGAAGRRPGKLIFVTPRKTRYLFAFDRSGKDIIPCTPGELSNRFRSGGAVIIDEPNGDSLFDRIMKSLVGKLRATEVQPA